MAKTKAKKSDPSTVTITYDLFDLPSAQHKAGLAGLLLQIESMRNRGLTTPTFEFDELEPHTKVRVTFTPKTVNAMFDDLYAAEPVNVQVKSKWKGAELVDTIKISEEVKGKRKVVEKYVYSVIQPSGRFLGQYIVDGKEEWLKLWRNMLWEIPRGNPQSRQPFEQCAAGKTCKEGPAVWKDLVDAEKAGAKNQFKTSAVAGSLWLGAQASTAENIPYKGRVEQIILLHFWMLTSLVFVPQCIEPDGNSEFVGYVLAVPEVANLPQFMAAYRRVLGSLKGDMRGYRPAESVIDVPAEGALSFLEHLAQLSAAKSGDLESAYTVSGIEFFHMVKVAKNIKLVSTGRIVPRPGLLNRYLAIVGAPGQKPPFGNPLFRSGLLRGLLNDTPWYAPFADAFGNWPHELFVHSDDSPNNLPWFWADVRKYLKLEIFPMTDPDEIEHADEDTKLMDIIHRLVRQYVTERAEKKSGIEIDNFKEGDKIKWERVPKGFKDDRRSVAETLFLEFRSRRDQAFVDHFSQTLFSAKQFLSVEQFKSIGHALLHRTEDVKTLTLMALSANS